MLLWTWGSRYLFRLVLSFSSEKYPDVELLRHMVVLFSCLLFLKYTLLLPPPPFLFSFLPPGDAVTALKAAYDPRIRTEEEYGPEARPFAPGNLTIPALFEACCESPPLWHLSGPQAAFTVVE